MRARILNDDANENTDFSDDANEMKITRKAVFISPPPQRKG